MLFFNSPNIYSTVKVWSVAAMKIQVGQPWFPRAHPMARGIRHAHLTIVSLVLFIPSLVPNRILYVTKMHKM